MSVMLTKDSWGECDGELRGEDGEEPWGSIEEWSDVILL